MEHVAIEELERPVGENEDEEVLHSFYPQPWSENASQIPTSAEAERRNISIAGEDAIARFKAMDKARRFLPCHYFDHVCGSSTGA